MALERRVGGGFPLAPLPVREIASMSSLAVDLTARPWLCSAQNRRRALAAGRRPMRSGPKLIAPSYVQVAKLVPDRGVRLGF